MWYTFVITAFRNIKKSPFHFLLNWLGFSIGIAASILVALYVFHLASFDVSQPESDRVYRIHQDLRPIGLSLDGAINSTMPKRMQNHSDIEQMLILTEHSYLQYSGQPLENIISVGNRTFKLSNFYASTPNLLEFVNLSTLNGSIKHALSEPNLIALSKREAIRLFGHTNVIGKRLKHLRGQYTVSAVFNDLPNNSHFAFDVLTSQPSVQRGPFGSHVYVRLTPNSSAKLLASEMTQELHRVSNNPRSKEISFLLIPLKELYFNTNGPQEMKQGGSYIAKQVSILLCVLILSIACVNFINFNIAGSSQRAKEVGIRKALGASKPQLVIQFLFESTFIVMLSTFMALALVEITLPYFNQLVDRELTLDYQSWSMVAIIMTLLTIGVVAGLYPALFISSFSAKRVLSGDLTTGSAATRVRKITLCLQGAIAVSLITAVVIIYQQMSLIKAIDVGYAKENRLVIRKLPAANFYNNPNNAFMQDLANLPEVKNVTLNDTDYATSVATGMHFIWPNGETFESMQPSMHTGYYPVKTLGLRLIAGRDFSPEYQSDWYSEDRTTYPTAGVILTKNMLTMAGINSPEKAIGLELGVVRSDMRVTVVGVIDNVQFGSINQPKLPTSLILGYHNATETNIVLNVEANAHPKLQKQVQTIILKHFNRSDVDTQWVIDEYLDAHKNELKLLSVVSTFTPLAIFLSLLGTVGLASFSSIRRQKEIAIRKVLGASRLTLINILAKEFIQLLFVSCCIALPLTYWVLNLWLSHFNERVMQTGWVYVFSAGTIVCVTWMTVALIGYRTASLRPSLVLRDE